MNEKRLEAQVIGPGSPGHIRIVLGLREQDVPIDRVPPALRMPNSQFIAVIAGGEFIRVEPDGNAWIDIQNKIRSVLNKDWDPIGVADAVDDEYDGYIGRIYHLLQRNASVDAIAEHLRQIETRMMGLTGFPAASRMEVAQRLRALELPQIPAR